MANHSPVDLCIECDDDGDDIDVVCLVSDTDGINANGIHNNTDALGGDTNMKIVGPECATTTVAEERKVLLLEAAIHKAGKGHAKRVYTFVVDYGQNMELPVYNQEQRGCTYYYYSPLSIYNLGMVNHGHTYENGKVGAHMYAHIYHEGVGKKGANNVSSLIVKTLRLLDLLRDDEAGFELNVEHCV